MMSEESDVEVVVGDDDDKVNGAEGNEEHQQPAGHEEQEQAEQVKNLITGSGFSTGRWWNSCLTQIIANRWLF
jgi:hypothetical protein